MIERCGKNETRKKADSSAEKILKGASSMPRQLAYIIGHAAADDNYTQAHGRGKSDCERMRK